MDTFYPGHDLPATERKEKAKTWEKNLGSLRREKLAIDSFSRIMKPRFRSLIHFVAYTGCRIKEALHLEWDTDMNGTDFSVSCSCGGV